MAEQAPPTRRDMEAEIIARAMKDEGFARELRADPRAVLEREVGGRLPEGIEIKVVEETPDTLYLVLPARPSPDVELSEAELDRVAGGDTTSTCSGGCLWVKQW
jgi:hypothetical protein